MKSIKTLFTSAVFGMAAFMSACAASFTGDLYAYWYDDEEDCGLYCVEESWKNGTTWRTDFVEVDGVKEPALFGFDCYAFPVTVSPGEEFSASIVHGTSTDAHIKSVKVLTDAEMYTMFRNSEKWTQRMSELWSGGTEETRAWVVVEQNNVTSGSVYTLDLAGIRIVDRATGGLSSTTLGEYAKRYGSRVSGTVGLTQSVCYQVAIEDCCSYEIFSQRVWNVCDPFWQDYDPIEAITDHGGDEDLYDAPGLYFVTGGMLGRSSAGVLPSEWKKARILNGAYSETCARLDVDGVCQLKCGKANKKGIAKVSLTITPFVGKKRTYKSVSVDVSKGGPVEVKWPKQSYTVTINGNEFFGEPVYGEWRPVCSPKSVWSADVGGKWTRTDSVAEMDYYYDEDSELPKGTCEELLPFYEPIHLKAGRWSFAKAAMVKLSKDGTSVSVDQSKGRSNVSAMRLTYTPKTGIFKGSFRVYALIDVAGGKKRLKKYTVKVMGAVVDGEGCGVGSLKSYGTPFVIAVH